VTGDLFSLFQFRIFTAPFHYVGFADFWLADQLISLTTVLLDLEYLICFYSIEVDWLGYTGWLLFSFTYTISTVFSVKLLGSHVQDIALIQENRIFFHSNIILLYFSRLPTSCWLNLFSLVICNSYSCCCMNP